MTCDLTIILPMYNEEAVVPHALEAISAQLAALELEWEILCVDDGSRDGTERVLREAAARDGRIVPVHFSRNFGKEAALAAGLDIARGQAVILMDADLQHPPELIGRMVAAWRQGFQIVDCLKAQRGRENPLHGLFARLFYRLIGGSLSSDMRGASDFKLLDREVVDALRAIPERGRFFRGLVSWVGFPRTTLEYDVQERVGGKTTWSALGLLRYAVNNLLAFSTAPLYLTAWTGFVVTILGLLLGIQTLFNYLVGRAVSGFTTVILLLIIFSGVILSSIGIVATYLAKVLDEVKNRPVYIVRRGSPTDRRDP